MPSGNEFRGSEQGAGLGTESALGDEFGAGDGI